MGPRRLRGRRRPACRGRCPRRALPSTRMGPRGSGAWGGAGACFRGPGGIEGFGPVVENAGRGARTVRRAPDHTLRMTGQVPDGFPGTGRPCRGYAPRSFRRTITNGGARMPHRVTKIDTVGTYRAGQYAIVASGRIGTRFVAGVSTDTQPEGSTVHATALQEAGGAGYVVRRMADRLPSRRSAAAVLWPGWPMAAWRPAGSVAKWALFTKQRLGACMGDQPTSPPRRRIVSFLGLGVGARPQGGRAFPTAADVHLPDRVDRPELQPSHCGPAVPHLTPGGCA